jgi:hypothetical protein
MFCLFVLIFYPLVYAKSLLCLGFVLTIEVVSFMSSADQAEGKVISVGKRSSGSGWRYDADVSFPDKNNQVHTVHFNYITTPLVSFLSAGRSITVLYSADDPAGSARLDFFLILWFWPGLFFVAGLGAGVLAWRVSSRPIPPPPLRRPVPPKAAPKV